LNVTPAVKPRVSAPESPTNVALGVEKLATLVKVRTAIGFYFFKIL
jgi:hypothetical protein